MLDTVTLRVAFGLVATCVLVLSYGVTYRSTRSAFSGWWCVSLASFVTSALLFLLNGTPVQVVANPLGNTVAVYGAACVWAGARSLRAQPPRLWQRVLGPGVVLVASLLDDPVHDVWTGGPFYLAGMSALVLWSTWELFLVLRDPLRRRDSSNSQYRFAVLSMAVTSGVIGVFYALRAVFFVLVGPHGEVFEVAFGSQATTLMTMVLLVVVTFSMTALGHDQQTSELRVQATRDGLTGALNRTEFLRTAQRRLDLGGGGASLAVVVADLDHFKEINDDHGHAAGDRALFAFADACRAVIGQDGVVGRLGGDEFVLLTTGPAEEVVEQVARRYLARAAEGTPLPTASFGIAEARKDDEVAALVTKADIALYQAKAAGRGCAVRYDGHLPAVTGGRRAG